METTPAVLPTFDDSHSGRVEALDLQISSIMAKLTAPIADSIAIPPTPEVTPTALSSPPHTSAYDLKREMVTVAREVGRLVQARAFELVQDVVNA